MDSRSSRKSRPSFKKTILTNGLTVITERQKAFQGLSVGFWIKAGTRHEEAREAGISHFLEHMLFKGTETRDALDISRMVDQVGGEFNAFTAREQTCFHINLLAKDLPVAAEILSDVLLNSTFDPNELERERKVILQEIAMVEDNPDELVFDIYYELVFGKHGLGRPILGSESSVRRLKRADILRYFRKHYRPENMVVAVTGNVSHEKVIQAFRAVTRREWPGRPGRTKAEIRRALQAWKSGAHPSAPTKPNARAGRWWIKRPGEQVHVIWGMAAPAYGSRDRIALALINLYLGGGVSSLLFQEIREKRGLAYTVYSSFSAYMDSGLFTVYAGTSPGQVAPCVKLIEECIDRLKLGGKAFPINDEELSKLKENLKGTIILSAESLESRMVTIASNEILMEDYLPLDKICKEIDDATLADLKRVARKQFKKRGTSLLFLGPAPTPATRKKLRPQFPKRFNR